MFKEIKKGDVLLLAAFLAAALLIALSPALRSTLSSHRNHKEENAVLEIRIAGDLYGSYSLSEDQTLEIHSSYGNNTLTISGGTAAMTASDFAFSPLNGPPGMAFIRKNVIKQIRNRVMIASMTLFTMYLAISYPLFALGFYAKRHAPRKAFWTSFMILGQDGEKDGLELSCTFEKTLYCFNHVKHTKKRNGSGCTCTIAPF